MRCSFRALTAVTKAGVHRLHQESAASLAGLTGFNDRPSQFTLLQALREVVTDKTGETIEFLKRDVLNPRCATPTTMHAIRRCRKWAPKSV
jgi:hypothetical protein